MPGALNVGVNPYPGQSGHMAATLPNGVNFEGGGGTGGGAQYGGSASGALDPQFEKQYYLPTGAASPSAMGPAPIGGGLGSPSPTGWGTGGISAPLGAGGQGFGIGATPGMAGRGAGAPVGFSTGVDAGINGGGGTGGIGVNGELLGMAGSAADIFAPGSSVGLKLANRAIQFAGQAAAIGVTGAVDTFLPAGSPLAANSWFSKLAGGIAGAKPASPNKAGGPGGGAPGQQPPAMGTPASGQGTGPAPGPTFNTTVNNSRAQEDGTGKDITAHLGAMYGGPGR